MLHRVVASQSVMIAQLEQLMKMSELPHVSIRIVPYEAGLVPDGVNKFVILRFVLAHIADLVLIEELTSHRYFDEPDAVETYNSTFRALTELALDHGASRALILRMIDAYQSKIES